MPIPVPIVITVTATPDPNDPGKLNISTDKPDTIFLSYIDDDQVRWVCNDGDVEVRFGPASNPFDAGAYAGGTYQTQPGGSVISGSLEPDLLNPDPETFNTYKYSIVVTSTDKTRVGTRDPRFKTRRNTVYRGRNTDNK
ncbi:MAG: hypothetical protein IPJ07_15195 [Acidobacteria bacterium]|nr:hypothetical protein [Acidobacteriota bacterium]MBK9708910.1 hypothetical protein [Acidobacteriota bacterium]